MKLLLIILLNLIVLCFVKDTICPGKPGQYYVNEQPIWFDDTRLMKHHKYGQLHEIGDGDTKMHLLHVYGTPYQMGLAQGVLLKTQINSFVDQLWKYIQDQSQKSIPKKIPSFIKNKLTNFATATALDLNFQITLPYTNKKYYEEMRGISEGSGVDFKFLKRVHMISQLIKGSSSMFGAWGKATLNSKVVQLRALDWDFDAPYRKYPVVVVYHPSNKKYGNTWMNIGFMGWVGVLSGVNEHQLAVSQIGVSYPDNSFGKQSRFGNPYTFVLRDVLQWDRTLNQSINSIKTTKRTCDLILGVGDGKSQFRSFQYSHSVCNVIADTNPLPKQNWHPAIQNAVYYAMDWNCPTYHERLYELLQKTHGKITAEATIRTIAPSLNSGNLQVVVYDLSNQLVYFSYGSIDDQDQKIEAYKRPFIALNLTEVFAHRNVCAQQCDQ